MDELVEREWLVTNGLGGYASGTLGGVATRRYHGLLIAALPAPAGRRVMLNHVMEFIRFPDGGTAFIGGEELSTIGLKMHGCEYLREFRLELGLPVWQYAFGDAVVEKRVIFPHRQNTVHLNYRLVSGNGTLRLKLRPSVHFRGHEEAVDVPHAGPYTVSAAGDRFELGSAFGDTQPLRLFVYGAKSAFTLEQCELPVYYRVEQSRGYESKGTLWSPGYFRADLGRDSDVTLVASTNSWDTMLALTPAEALQAEKDRRRRLLLDVPEAVHGTMAADLVLAADQFIITPEGRKEDATRARASGEEVRSVIAGYHWFTDWGRDTMISLEGLTLTTGRLREARWILHTFAHYIRDGLLPNLFPEGEKEGLYHTADATLWFFHTLHRYVEVSQDRLTLSEILPRLVDIVDHHLKGTRFGIGVDHSDGLLRQGAEGYQLTWMDAKVGDWVVTPRRGKAVEINALWYNALCLLARYLEQESGDSRATEYRDLAAQVKASFNGRFWFADGGYLYDLVDTEGAAADPAIRPNQIFAVSLDYPVLDEVRWKPVVDVVQKHLLTPFGLRSLAPGHPDYKPKYFGDLRSRDAAYHQGTVWGWLIGPFVDAWLRVHPGDRETARGFLSAFVEHLSEACVGSISEVFDAEAPFTPRACIAQAWSVAEVLRIWQKVRADNRPELTATGDTKQ